MVFYRKTCFKCGNAGHIASDCAEADRLCYNCKQPGHLSSECTEEKVIEAKQCFNCGEVGHIAAQCTTPTTQPTRGKDKKQCFNCQQMGHIARDCTNESQPRSTESRKPTRTTGSKYRQVICEKCGGLNHYAKDCQASDILCYSCQKQGHIARDCPLTVASIQPRHKPNRETAPRLCYTCGKPGHIARNCFTSKREKDDDEDSGSEETDVSDEETDSNYSA